MDSLRHGNTELVNANKYSLKSNPNYIHSLDDIKPLVAKVQDCFLNCKVILGGSVATYHNLDYGDKRKFELTMQNHDIDIFIMEKERSIATCAFKALAQSYLGLVDLGKPADPEYYKMKGLLRVFSFYSGELARKINIVILDSKEYNDCANTLLENAMGHSLSKAGYLYNMNGTLTNIKVVEFSTCTIKTKKILFNTHLLTEQAYIKLKKRAAALGYSMKQIS